MGDEIETNVLEKVAEMLTDNIYDIIPGYSELELNVQEFKSQFEVNDEKTKGLQEKLEKFEEANRQFSDEFALMK